MSQVSRRWEVGNHKRRSLNTRLSSGTSTGTSHVPRGFLLQKMLRRSRYEKTNRTDILYQIGKKWSENRSSRFEPILLFSFSTFRSTLKTGFATDSGYERTFSKLPKVIQVPWKLPKQKNFYILIVDSFNQNKLSLRSNVSGGFGHKCRRLPPSRWRCRRK